MDRDDEIEIDISRIKNMFKKKDKDISKIDDKIEKEKMEIKELKEAELDEREKVMDLEEKKKELEEAKQDLGDEEEKLEIIRDEKEKIEKQEKKEEEAVKKDKEKIEKIKEDAFLDIGNAGKNAMSAISSGSEKAYGFFKNNKYAIPVLLIITAIFFSTFFRMYPAELPITDKWAEDSVENFYKNQLSSEVSKQYPNLPSANRKVLINERYEEMLDKKKDTIQKQIDSASANFKSRFQYDFDGKEYTYLLAIDPYLWYGYGKNYLECGHAGCDKREDGKYYVYRNGRFGQHRENIVFSKTGLWIHKLINIFGDYPLMHAFFLLPVIFIGLSCVPAFFIGRRMGGNFGGFFAAMIIAVNSAVLSRTPGGFSDTDNANVLFPLLIIWFFIEAFYSDDWKKTGIFSILGGVSFYLYSEIWRIQHIFNFVLGAAVIYLLAVVTREVFLKKEKKLMESVKGIKGPLSRAGTFIGVSLIALIISQGFGVIKSFVTSMLNFAMIKDVAVAKIWPNVMTTVAEFNAVPLGQIVDQMGGGLLFAFAVMGIIFSLFMKDKNGSHYILYSALLLLWFFGTGYAFTKGVRFALLMAPAFAVACGIGAGVAYNFLSRWISSEFSIDKRITSTVIGILLLLMLIAPINSAHKTAMGEIPSYNDAWDSSLEKIREDASDGIGYITTWWDFGHWFVAMGSRVTFDGGNQGERIHWVGKSLIEDDEKKVTGILKMLNCGQEVPPHILECSLADGEWKWENEIAGTGECDKEASNEDTVESVKILEKMFLMEKEDAEKLLKEKGLDENEIHELLEYTHCEDTLPQYFITSEDMVGKAGVWGHFGSWDFEKALMWQKVRNEEMSYEEGLKFLMEELNLSESKADKYYYEIQNTKADKWISPWPGYHSKEKGCNKEGDELVCGNGVHINMKSMDAYIQGNDKKIELRSLAYIGSDKRFKVKEYDNDSPYSAALIPRGNQYKSILLDPLQAGSMFTRLFFFEGHGLEHFELFSEKTQVTGGKIQVWKVDFEGGKKTDIFSREKEIKASHILISTNNRTDAEAEEKIKEIESMIDGNFGEIAERYSEGPSAERKGDLGWFGKGDMVKEFEDAAFSLSEGEISKPVKTNFGYHLIKATGRRGFEDDASEETDSEKAEDEESEDEKAEESEDDASRENKTENSSKKLEFDIEI